VCPRASVAETLKQSSMNWFSSIIWQQIVDDIEMIN